MEGGFEDEDIENLIAYAEEHGVLQPQAMENEENEENVGEGDEIDEIMLNAANIVEAWREETEERKGENAVKEHYEKRMQRWLQHHSLKCTHPVERLGLEKADLMEFSNMRDFYVAKVEEYWKKMEEALKKMGRAFVFMKSLEDPKKMARNGVFESFYLTLALSKEQLEHQCTFPLLDKNVLGNPHHRRMFANTSNSVKAQFKNLTPLKEHASIMHCIARHMEENHYCVVDGFVHQFVPGTSYKVIEPMTEYPDEMDGTNRRQMPVETFVRRVGMGIPEVQFFISMGVNNPYSYAIDLITKGGSHLIYYPEKRWDYFAFSNKVVRVSVGPKRARSGQLRPHYSLMDFEEVPDNIVCARYIDKEFSPILFKVPLGFMVPKTPEELKEEEESGLWDHLGGLGTLNKDKIMRRENEGPEVYLRRFRAHFKVVERKGEQLRDWVHQENTNYMAIMFSVYQQMKYEHLQQYDEGEAPPFYWPFTMDKKRPDHPDVLTLIGRCSVFMHTMGTQEYTDQAMFTFFVCIGRSFFPARTMENWQCFMLVVGEARTGKGTMLDVLYDFFGDGGVAQVKNDTKDLFALGGLTSNQRVLYFPDIINFKVFSREMLLKMAAHESEVIRRMRENPENVRWMQKLFMASNCLNLLVSREESSRVTTAPKDDEKKKKEGEEKEEKKVDVGEEKRRKNTPAISTRAVIFKNEKVIDFKAFDTSLDQKRQEEVAPNFAMCLRAISDMKDALGSIPLMSNLPRTCYDSMMDVKAVEILRAFLDDSKYVEFVPRAQLEKAVTMEDLKNAYAEFFAENSTSRLTDDHVRRVHATINMRNSGFKNALLERGFVIEEDTIYNMKLNK